MIHSGLTLSSRRLLVRRLPSSSAVSSRIGGESFLTTRNKLVNVFDKDRGFFRFRGQLSGSDLQHRIGRRDPALATVAALPHQFRTFASSVAAQQDDAAATSPSSKKPSSDETGMTRNRMLLVRRKRLKDRQKMIDRRSDRKQKRLQQQQQAASAQEIPPYTVEEIDSFAEYLTRMFPSKQLHDVLGKLKTLMTNNSSSAETGADEFPLVAVLQTLLHATNPNRPAQLAILEFLLRTERSPIERNSKAQATTKSDDTITEIDQAAIQTIVLARQQAVANDLQWSQADRRDTARQLNGTMDDRQAWLDSKSVDVQQQEAQDFLALLHDSMPLKQYHSVIRLFEMYIGANSTIGEADIVVVNDDDDDDCDDASDDGDQSVDACRPFSMRNLSSHLAQRAGAHFFLVAEHAASFFGMSHAVMEKVSKYNRAKQKWEKQLLRNTKMLTGLQDILQASIMTEAEEEEGIFVDYSDAVSDSDKLDAFAIQTEELLNLSAEGDVDPTAKSDQRFRRPAHIVYDVIQLRETCIVEPATAVPSLGRMVFLDNLPIDMTTDRLMELYSRCGDVSSVTIYNQRPDLDPGPLTPTKLRARRKKQFRVAGSRRRRWQRPRSPVYAQMTFADEAGYKACCIDELRIFGMIVQKHPIRSLRASDMTSLFVEDMPDKVFCTDLELRLNELVREGLFATAAAGENRRARVGSCEIKFPSFELAFESYQKMQDSTLHSWSESSVHWMRTPHDADSWWKRKRGFD